LKEKINFWFRFPASPAVKENFSLINTNL